jgi:hypothetical protein
VPAIDRAQGQMSVIENAVPEVKSKSSLFPVLVFLFVVSYVLLTMLVVEQGKTIQSQRSLIHLLWGDSVRLAHSKGQEMQAQRHGLSLPPEAGKDLKNNKVQKAYPQKLPRGIRDTPDARRNLLSI